MVENDKCKILWDIAIQKDKEIEHRKPDIVVIDKQKIECKIIDIAVKSEGTRKNHQIAGLKIASPEVVRSQNHSYTYCSWCFRNN